MRVLVMGSTGVIGTGMTRQLVERGEDVTLYNRGQREGEIPGAVQRILGDRTRCAAFEAQMADAGPLDAVIDMVAFRSMAEELAIGGEL